MGLEGHYYALSSQEKPSGKLTYGVKPDHEELALQNSQEEHLRLRNSNNKLSIAGRKKMGGEVMSKEQTDSCLWLMSHRKELRFYSMCDAKQREWLAGDMG